MISCRFSSRPPLFFRAAKEGSKGEKEQWPQEKYHVRSRTGNKKTRTPGLSQKEIWPDVMQQLRLGISVSGPKRIHASCTSYEVLGGTKNYSYELRSTSYSYSIHTRIHTINGHYLGHESTGLPSRSPLSVLSVLTISSERLGVAPSPVSTSAPVGLAQAT